MRYKAIELFLYETPGQVQKAFLPRLPAIVLPAEPGDTIILTNRFQQGVYHRVPGESNFYNYVTKKGNYNYDNKGKKTTKTDYYVVVLQETDPIFNFDLILPLLEKTDPIYSVLKDIFRREMF